jgi:3-oxoadipate enol-lactonase
MMATLNLNDIVIYYEIHGAGDPVVFIHGLGSSTRDWEYQIDEFSQDFQVVVFDVRGHGKSTKHPGPYSIPTFARDTSEVIKKLDIGPTHVVGISMGGMIGLQLAVDYPNLVRSLVVVNSGAELTIKNMKDRLQVWQRLLIPRLLGMRKMGEVLSDRLFPKEAQSDLRKIFIERWAENDPKAYNEAFKALVGWSVLDRVKEIECPVLVIAADEDYTPVETKATYVEKLKQGELVVIKDSRHASPVDQPGEFNRVLREYLAKQ